MKKHLSIKILVAILIVAFGINCKKERAVTKVEKTNTDSVFVSLYAQLTPPIPGEWRSEHPEPDQSVDAYKSANPAIPDSVRKYIYLAPLNEFNTKELILLDITAEYLSAVFGLQVKIKPGISIRDIPSSKKRNGQLNSGYILHDLLIKILPDDAVGMMAITSYDLYPGEEWNFVFGEANTQERVGVSSFYRYGDAAESDSAFNLCLRRLMETTSHEFLHMLSMQHCKTFSCVLNGSNSLQESDKKPLIICPQCAGKLNFALNENPSDYFSRSLTFFNKYGFLNEAQFCKKALTVLSE